MAAAEAAAPASSGAISGEVVFQLPRGDTQYVILGITPALQLDVGKEGLISVRSRAVIPFVMLTMAQSSPASAVYHFPQFRVVPLAMLAFCGGGTMVMAY